ncbi:transglycosylase SLT domain-containing protein [Variovorax sp. LjRoot175]|uniref:transglycosylase SLT domain-containing protein n=1 Tax=Variovorax sp. LjRoot175 TaxID=3342276 RepID=UPI003ED039F3
MAGGWGHALAAGVDGYLRGKRIVRDREEDEENKKWRDETRSRQRKAWAEEDDLKSSLKNASRPVALEEGAGGVLKPDYMDNRDVGQAGEKALKQPVTAGDAASAGASSFSNAMASAAEGESDRAQAAVQATSREGARIEQSMAAKASNAVDQQAAAQDEASARIMQGAQATVPAAAPPPLALRVGGKDFSNRAEAEAELARQNSPEAQTQRVAQAYRSAGQVEKAMALESGDRQGELQKMQLADQRWKRDLGTAMRKGHAGLAELATNSEAGPMAGLKVQPVISEDGKSVTYAALDKDGKAAPIPGLPQFSNDERGLVQAAWMLDRTIDPSARMAHYDQQEQRDRAQKNSDRSYEQSERHFNTTSARADRTEDRQGRLADTQIRTAELSLKDAERSAKIPPAVKMQVEGWRKEADTINAAVIKAQADGTWDVNNPNAKTLIERQAVVNARISKALTPYVERDTGAADPFGLKAQGRNAGANGGQGGGAGRGSTPISFKDPVWDGAEVEASKKTGVPTEVMRTIRTVGERSNSDQVSPKGAKGVYQFIQSTRDKFLKKYGVDAYSEDPEEQALAAAYHLKESYDRTGSWDKAMAGFNGGTSAEKGTNKTQENRAYSARTSAALAAQDPMAAVYKKQVAELNRGTRTELSPDVAAWKQRSDGAAQKEGEQRFNAAQQAYLQEEKLKAQKKDKELAASTRAS